LVGEGIREVSVRVPNIQDSSPLPYGGVAVGTILSVDSAGVLSR